MWWWRINAYVTADVFNVNYYKTHIRDGRLQKDIKETGNGLNSDNSDHLQVTKKQLWGCFY